MVGSTYEVCPMCGCEDGQGCSKDCPSEVIPRLEAENTKLRAALKEIAAYKRGGDLNTSEKLERDLMIGIARAALEGK